MSRLVIKNTVSYEEPFIKHVIITLKINPFDKIKLFK